MLLRNFYSILFLNLWFISLYNLISGCQDGGGFIVSYNDIAGVYSGIVFSIANTLGSIPGF